MGAVADLEKTRIFELAALLQGVDLPEQNGRVDNDSVANHANRPRMEHTAGNQVQHRLLVTNDLGVARVVATLKANHDVGMLGEKVDDLPLPFIAPLGANDDNGRHDSPLLTETGQT
jgi:hypothetical protein